MKYNGDNFKEDFTTDLIKVLSLLESKYETTIGVGNFKSLPDRFEFGINIVRDKFKAKRHEAAVTSGKPFVRPRPGDQNWGEFQTFISCMAKYGLQEEDFEQEIQSLRSTVTGKLVALRPKNIKYPFIIETVKGRKLARYKTAEIRFLSGPHNGMESGDLI